MTKEKPDDLPLQHDLSAIAGHATSEYDMSPSEIAETMREKADSIENDAIMERLYLGAKEELIGNDR